MSVSYLGSLTLGAVSPGSASAAAAGTAGISAALPDIQARIAAMVSFAPTPVDFAASITLAQSTIASIQSALAFGISPPSIDAQIATIAAELAALQVQLASIETQLAVVADFSAVLETPGVHAYAYVGPVNQMGSDVSATLSGGFPGGTAGDNANALILGTSSPTTWAAMGQVFKTS